MKDAVTPVDPAAMEALLTREADTAAGLILALAWQAGLSREEIASLQWSQVDLAGGRITLPGREVPLPPALSARLALREGAGYVVPSARGGGLRPESVSRLARTALDSAGLSLTLGDLRRDHRLRESEQEPAPPEADEFRLWQLLRREGGTPAGLALWLSWQMGLHAREMLALTWDQVDLWENCLRLPGRTVPLTAAVGRLLLEERSARTPEDDPHVLLTPRSRRPLDAARLSRMVGALLARAGMPGATLRSLRRDDGRRQGEDALLAHAARHGSLTRREAETLLACSREAARRRLRHLTEQGRLTRVGSRYYAPGTVTPPERQRAAVRHYLAENGAAYRQDIAHLLGLDGRRCGALLRKMAADGEICLRNQRYFLP